MQLTFQIITSMQDEIFELLKKRKVAMTRLEISIQLKVDACHVSRALKNMIKYKEVGYKEVDKETAYKLYKCKRRLRVYFV